MDLLDYPRPINDTGIGVHWSAGISHVSLAQLRSFWIPELQALGVCWVKIADHRYALSLAEELLAVGIMPIVQIQRQDSRTLAFSSTEIEAVDALVAAGVRYFEPQYVTGSLRVPPLREAIHLVADRVVADLESVLARGGLPALPPLAPQHHFDLLRLLIERGHLNLIRGPIWQALRNGGLNRPLNFPHDPGHRDGAPLTQEYYDALSHEEWRGDAWQGRELPWINNLRRQASQGSLPDTVKIPGDEECWLAYEAIDAINQRLLGRSLPILSTAGGWVVGAKEDPRYPAVTPLLHLAQTLEACRVMMGTSRRYAPAPDAFFCTAFWLLANDAVESDRPAPEEEAWYSAVWPQQTLPIVPALKAEPKRTRLPFWTPARQTATEKPVEVVSQTTGEGVSVTGATSTVNVATASRLSGHVRGGANTVLCLVRADGVLYRTLAASDGYFEFVDLARGRYTIWVEQPVGSRRENIELDGRNHVELKLTVDRWGHEVIPLEEVGPSLLRCRVESSLLTTEAGTLAIRVRRSDDSSGQSSRVVPLARRADGVAGCEITPLPSGEYRVEVLGVTGGDGDPFALEAQARIGGPTLINFVFNRPFERGFLQFSVIYGQVVGGWGQQLVLIDAQGRQRFTEVDEQDRYAFDHLAPGLYSIALLGHEQTTARNRIGIDGKNQVQVNFTIVADELSTQRSDDNLGMVELHLPEGAELDEDFRLVSVAGDFYIQAALTQAALAEGQPIRFDGIPGGIYTLSGNGYWQPGVDVQARQVAVITLPALAPAWTWRVDEQTVGEGGEGILIHVLGRGGLPIVVVNEEGEQRVTATGSIEDAPFSAWIDQLPAGGYFISPEGLDAEAIVTLEAGRRATVTFRRNGVSAGLSHISYRSPADPA